MRLVLGGVRGTSPVADPKFAEFGGDTSAFLVEGSNGEAIVIDAGSGVRVLDPYLRQTDHSSAVLLLMTHYHLDHLMGFPSFSVIYDSTWDLEIKGPRLDGVTASDAVRHILSRPFWPLQLEALGGNIVFTDLPEDGGAPHIYHGLEVRWCPVPHLGGCVSYRLDDPATRRSVVIATDVEWPLASETDRHNFMEFCKYPAPPDLLVFDGQFTPENYERFRGWGHSTWQDAIDVAKLVMARELIITHHHPRSDDETLRQIEADVKRQMPNAWLGRQDAAIEIG